MNYRSFVRPALAVVAATAFVACGKKTMETAPSANAGASASASMARPANALPNGVTLAMVAQGDSIFHARSCKNCHGMDAKGAANGPDLTSGKFLHVDGSYDSFVRIITTGVPKDSIKVASHPNAMGPRGGARPAPLTDDQIRSVAAYVYSLNHKM